MYTKGQAIDFIEKVFGKGALTNQGQNISVLCPICAQQKTQDYSKKKLAIHSEKHLVKCWVCGYKSRNLMDLIKRFHPGFLKEYIDVFVGLDKYLSSPTGDQQIEKRLELPRGFKLIAALNTDHKVDPLTFDWASFYLHRRFRGETESIVSALWYWKFGIELEDFAFQRRVIVPSFDINGDLNYYTARTTLDNVLPKYRNADIPCEDIIFNEINIRWDEPLTVVEGPFDLVKCNPNATCLLGSDLTTEYKLFLMLVKHKTPVILALDPDARRKTLKIARLLFEYGVQVSILDIPDNFKDVGEMTKRQFMDILNCATPFNMDFSLRDKISRLLK